MVDFVQVDAALILPFATHVLPAADGENVHVPILYSLAQGGAVEVDGWV